MNKSQRPQWNVADFMLIGLTPGLIMAMLGAFVIFVFRANYHGPYVTRGSFIFAMYVIGVVGIARISMDHGKEHAALFSVPMAIVMFMATYRFTGDGILPRPFMMGVGMIGLGVIWWLAHWLTWNCTLLDRSDADQGEGLLQHLGLDEERVVDDDWSGEPEEPSPDAAETSPPGFAAWWRSFVERARHKRAPGVTVIYFAIGALPLFGLGQWFLRSDAERRFGFRLLILFVSSGIGLLMTTSFLSLRIYLERRRIELSKGVSVAWLAGGTALVLLVLLLSLALPRPGAPLGSRASPFAFGSPDDLSTQRFAVGNDGPIDEARGQTTRQEDQPGRGAPGNRSGRGKSGSGGKAGTSPGSGKGGASGRGKSSRRGKSNGAQGGGKSRGGNGSDQGTSGGSGKSSKSGKSSGAGKSSSSRGPSGSRKGSEAGKSSRAGGKSKSGDSSREGQSSDGEKQGQGNGKEGNEGRQARGATGREGRKGKGRTDRQDKPSSGERKSSSGTSRFFQHGGARPANRSRASSAVQKTAELARGMATLLRYLFVAALGLVAGVLLWRYRKELLEGWRSLLADLRAWWARLFGKKPRREAAEEAPATVVAPAGPRRAFRDFVDPFRRGQNGMDAVEIVRYTFEAVEAWAFEQGVPRSAEMTPFEFVQHVGSKFPALRREMADLGKLYGRAAYAPDGVETEEVRRLAKLWQALG